MDAISKLMEEHRIILRALDALDGFAAQVAAGGGEKAELSRFVTFIKEFADARHHGKEEDVLFDAMVRAGFPRNAGPIGVMLTEHGVGREHVGVLSERAAQQKPWSTEERSAVVATAHYYAELLRGHIEKEDRILYPMARARLPAAAMAEVDAACAAKDEAGKSAGDRLEALARDLAERYVGG